MKTTSETPETDAQCYDCEYRGHMGGKFTAAAGTLHPYGDHAPADFARKLERERDEARKEIAKLLEWKRQAMIVDNEWEDVRKFLSRHPDITIGSSFAKSTIKFLNERDELAKYVAEERHAWEKEREDWQADYAAVAIENKAMREAIKEAKRAFGAVMNLLPDVPPWCHDNANAVLAKLQPFLT